MKKGCFGFFLILRATSSHLCRHVLLVFSERTDILSPCGTISPDWWLALCPFAERSVALSWNSLLSNSQAENLPKGVWSVALIPKRYFGQNIHKYLLGIKVPMTLAWVKSQNTHHQNSIVIIEWFRCIWCNDNLFEWIISFGKRSDFLSRFFFRF